MPEAQRRAQMQPVDRLLQALPALVLNEADVASLVQGRTIATDIVLAPLALARLYDGQGVFLGIGELVQPERLAPRRLVSQASRTAA
jgi:hypothetical protein